MDLQEVLIILRREHAPNAYLYDDDHICDAAHWGGACPYPRTAVYTKLDAVRDTPQSLLARLRRNPPQLKSE